MDEHDIQDLKQLQTEAKEILDTRRQVPVPDFVLAFPPDVVDSSRANAWFVRAKSRLKDIFGEGSEFYRDLAAIEDPHHFSPFEKASSILDAAVSEAARILARQQSKSERLAQAAVGDVRPIEPTNDAPVVFVSYSYDSVAHQDWVLRLATDLRAKGVDALLDKWEVGPGADFAAFMERGIDRADRVVLICTSPYVEKADNGSGGVGYEKMIVTRELVAQLSTEKFIPLVRGNPTSATPICLGTRRYIDFNSDDDYEHALEELLRSIHGAPRLAKPSIGPNPYADDSSGPARASSSVTNRVVFDDPWFRETREAALAKVQTHGDAIFELAFGPRSLSGTASPRELLDAVKASEIHTFGWPIGVVLDREDARPKPTRDGIAAEISHSGFTDKTQMDYWRLRKNGDFYLAHNLFEDQRDAQRIFFNTRIIRTAESVKFCQGVLTHLGLPSDTQVAIRVCHRGFRGRKIGTSNRDRHVHDRAPAGENFAEATTGFGLDISDDDIWQVTKRLLDSFFGLFDFFEIGDEIYQQIVGDFLRGKPT